MRGSKEKDITQKALEMYNDVFADIINVLLFNLKLSWFIALLP